jgi:uncharacterized repeat protein (TIGR02543 family)
MKNRSLPTLLSLAAALVCGSATLSAQTITTGADLWNEYILDPDNHSHIPNVSFAGYMRGEAPIPDVPVVVDITDFGGVGDGETHNDVALRHAIDAAWLQGGGAVYLPAGEYAFDQFILLHRSGVVLRGAGPGETILRFNRPLLQVIGMTGIGTQEWNWTGGLLWIGPRDYFRFNALPGYLRFGHERRSGRPVEFDEDPDSEWEAAWENWSTLGEAGILASVTSTHDRGTHTVTVDDASGLKAGDFVMMSWVNPRDTHALWHEMVQHEAFEGTNLFNAWLSTAIPHWEWPVEIKAVSGNEVTLAQSTRVSIQPEYNVTFKMIGPDGWQDRVYGGRWQALSPYVEKAGVEDLTLLMANTRETYGYNDGDGWNGLFFNRAYNSWARNVEILNAEAPIHVSSAKNITITDIDIYSPFQAKYISTARVHTHDVLFENIRVTNSGHVSNGINSEWMSAGNVWTRLDMEKGTFDSHRMMSFDYVRTDLVLDNPAAARPGGASQAGPHTGRRAVHWNITVRDSDRTPERRGEWVYDPEQYTYGAQIGIQGADPLFRSDPSTPSIWAMPAGDKNMRIGDDGVVPAIPNLYDAQLALRLGSAPFVILDTPADNFYSTTRPVVFSATGHPGTGATVQSLRYFWGTELLGEVTEAPYAFTWEDPIPGRHAITVEMVDNLGNVTTSRPYDVVVGQREFLEHNDPRIQYSGNWSVRTLTPPESGGHFFSSNQARWTASGGAYAEVTFRGTRFRWVTGHDGQGADVTLNGEHVADVGFRRVGNRAYNAIVWDSGDLPDDIHTVRITQTSGNLHIDHFIIDYTSSEDMAPFFIQQPQSLAVVEGASAVLVAQAVGFPIPSYQWFKDGVAIDGATSASLSFPSASFADDAVYHVVASNGVDPDAISDSAQLSVLLLPVITVQPQPANLTITEGSPLNLSVTVESDVTVTYKWQRNGEPISGATASTLSIPAIDRAEAGVYRVAVSNAASTVFSDTVEVDVQFSPSILSQALPATVLLGTEAHFAVVAEANPTAQYQWFFEGDPIPGATDAELTIASVTTADLGDYFVRVSNSVGSIDSDTVTLAQTLPPAPPADLVVSGVTHESISLAWTDTSAGQAGFTVHGADGTELAMLEAGVVSYTVSGLQPATAYTFTVRAFNAAGSSGDSNTTTAVTDPVFTLSFAANGADGSPPAPIVAPAGAIVSMPGQGGFTREGHAFNGWRDVLGAATYALGEDFTMPPSDLTLDAQWTVVEEEPIVVNQFNFGAAEYTGTNSPGHADWGVPLSFDEWTRVNGANIEFEPGKFVRFRRANGDGTNAGVTLHQTASVSNRSSAGATGVFDSALGKSWRSYTRGGFAGRSVGAWFEGLPHGDYVVYAVVHNPVLIADGRTTNVGIGTGSQTSGDLAWNDASLTGTSFPTNPQTATWEEGVNFAKTTVTVDADNPILYVLQGGPAAASNEFDFHTLTAVQLVRLGEITPGDGHTVTYLANDGSGPVPADANTYAPGTTITVMGAGALTRAGYTFTGWRDAVAGETFAPLDTFAMPGRDVTLVAQWSPDAADPYLAWVAANNIEGGPADATGGVANLVRYALGGDASTPAGELLPHIQSVLDPEGLVLSLTFERINDPQVSYAVWYSEDLADWGTEPVWQDSGAHGGVPGPFEVTVPTSAERGFLRLEVSR